ncbi:MAG: hypothetical protein A2083_02075 [Gemmatimonadetes bacterium GWC2_71_9]|nr:MAG: hypothetical protein A2083_02075 [Gemmatimonadetes bacterium GWC2_71_9]OGT96994.1 MAG: hypothetical protein A3I79_07755 [Gemmatimonadetes bacterium RIFCSPLOWO2_02_FULL_71_11]
MEGILAILLIFGGGTAVAISFSPIGRAIAERLRRRPGEAAPHSEEMDEVRDQLAALQQQVSELAERQDFAERLLAQARERGALGPGTER